MKMMDEFKEFINRGNVMDLAIGVIIGGAFTAIVTALTTNIINPCISLLTGLFAGSGDFVSGLVIPGTEIDFGALISAVINFFIIAMVVFWLTKTLNKLRSLGKKEEKPAEEEEPPTCPFCLEEVKAGATRCPHCAGAFQSPAGQA